MSRIYYSETGRVIPSLCEELTDYRRARKVLRLPGTRAPARLYLLARAYPEARLPLRLAVNGTELPGLLPRNPGAYVWHEAAIPPNLLSAGANTFEFWTDAPAMDAWSLALEDGHPAPDSYVSTDAGETWRNERMGYLNVARGEYVVRVRLAEGMDDPPPGMIWEDADHPRLRRLRRTLPAHILEGGTTLARVRALASWVCTRWEYRNERGATQYAPWDAETIIAWGQAGRGHDGRTPIVMCVHYAVVMVTCCLALGIPARCAVFTNEVNGSDGHFTAEVWFPELGKWVMVDPNLDAILFKAGVPLSVKEIQAAGVELADLIEWGPGHAFQMRNPVIAAWVPRTYRNGVCFRQRSLWPRTDFLSHPEQSPPGHGWSAYCETDLVWERDDLEQGFGMFARFGDADYFDAPPQGFPTSAVSGAIPQGVALEALDAPTTEDVL